MWRPTAVSAAVTIATLARPELIDEFTTDRSLPVL
jgi:hypothetical protein